VATPNGNPRLVVRLRRMEIPDCAVRLRQMEESPPAACGNRLGAGRRLCTVTTGPFGKIKILIPNGPAVTPSARACQRRASRKNTDPRTTTGISQPNPMWPAMPPSTLPTMITARTPRMIRRAVGR